MNEGAMNSATAGWILLCVIGVGLVSWGVSLLVIAWIEARRFNYWLEVKGESAKPNIRINNRY